MNEKITLRTTTKPAGQVVHYVQGANLIPLEFQIEDFNLPEDVTARFYLKRPSGSEVYIDGQVDGQTVTVKPTAQTFSEDGEQYGQLQIVSADGVLVSYLIHYQVERNLVDASAAPAGDEYSALVTATQAAAEATASANAAAAQATAAAEKAAEDVEQAIDRFLAEGADFQGATGSAAGVHGLVPAPPAGAEGKFLKGDGTFSDLPAQTEMTGATASKPGTAGTVPAPQAGYQGRYLAGDGAWKPLPTIPTKTSQLTNDSGYLTNANIADYVTSVTNQTLSFKAMVSGASNTFTAPCKVTKWKSGRYDITMTALKEFTLPSSVNFFYVAVIIPKTSFPSYTGGAAYATGAGYIGTGAGYLSRGTYASSDINNYLVQTGFATSQTGTDAKTQISFTLWP